MPEEREERLASSPAKEIVGQAVLGHHLQQLREGERALVTVVELREKRLELLGAEPAGTTDNLCAGEKDLTQSRIGYRAIYECFVRSPGLVLSVRSVDSEKDSAATRPG